MREIDYINATNLAKLRIAERVLRDCLFMDEDDAAEQMDAIDRIYRLRRKSERITETT